VPVLNGKVLPHAIQEVPIGGATLTRLFMNLVQHGVDDQRWDRMEDYADLCGRPLITELRDAKEKLCYVRGFHSSVDDTEEEAVVIAGEEINLSKERWFAPEVFFHPDIIGIECLPLHEAALVSAGSVSEDPNVLESLLQNIVLTGGSALLPGMADRLQEELATLVKGMKFQKDLKTQPGLVAASLADKVRVQPPRDKSYDPYHGAIRLASQVHFADHCEAVAPSQRAQNQRRPIDDPD